MREEYEKVLLNEDLQKSASDIDICLVGSIKISVTTQLWNWKYIKSVPIINLKSERCKEAVYRLHYT